MISEMGMVEVGMQKTYSLPDFCNEQANRIQETHVGFHHKNTNHAQTFLMKHFCNTCLASRRACFNYNQITGHNKIVFEPLWFEKALDTKLVDFRNLIRDKVLEACK